MTTDSHEFVWDDRPPAWISGFPLKTYTDDPGLKLPHFLLHPTKNKCGIANRESTTCCLPHLTKEWSFCLKAAKRVRDVYSMVPQLQTFMKPDQSPVTAVDVAIQGTMLRELSKSFSNDVLVAEEDIAELISNATFLDAVQLLVDFEFKNLCPDSFQKRHTRWWTLDPIDGTKGLISGGEFAVGLALHHSNNRAAYPVLGSLMLPRQGVLLLANVPASRLEIIPLDSLERFSDSEEVTWHAKFARYEECKTANVIKPWAKDWHFSGGKDFSLEGEVPWKPLCCGSLVKYAAVAQGKAFAFVQTLSMSFANSWDHAAGIAAVRASGGVVTDEYGNDFAVGTVADPRLLQLEEGSKAIVASARGVDHFNVCGRVIHSLRHSFD